MDGFVASVVALCLAGVVAIVGANGYLKQAQQEFQSRLRNAALARARQWLAGALLVWGGVAVLSAFGTAETATAAATRSTPAPVVHAEPLQLRMDHDINYTGR